VDASEIEGAEAFVLVETSGGRKEHDEEVRVSLPPSTSSCVADHRVHSQKLNDLLESLMGSDKPLVQTGVLAQSWDQFVQLWGLREGIPEAVSKEGKVYKYDISIPISTFKEFVDKVRERLIGKGLYKTPGGVRECIGYGHVGDGESFLPRLQSH